MPKLTIRKSGRKITRKTSTSTHSDTDFTSGPLPKRIKKVNNPIPSNTITVRTGDDDSDCESPPAVISSRRIYIADNLSIEVDDERSWKKVEKGVECWMLQNKKDINVKLTILYKNLGGMNAESSDDNSLSSKKV